MDHLRAKHVVVGAGAMGAATAYHLAIMGEPVTLVEQFPLGHDRGSSHGAARITRHSYADPRYARLMPAAFRAWRELEAKACQSLYIRTGGISFGPESNGYVSQVAANLAELDVPHRRLRARELKSSLPVFHLPDHFDAVFEPDAGMLSAARAVAVQIELARNLGDDRTNVYDSMPVIRIDLDAEHPTLVTANSTIVAERLIVTAGAWLAKLLPAFEMNLTPTKQQVLYFGPQDQAAFAIGRFPVFIYKGEAHEDQFYGMPSFLGGGVKVARHGGPSVDPDLASKSIDANYPGIVGEFLSRHIPSLADAPICQTETCLYTVAPDDDFRVGFAPGRKDVLIASPCSGHGFKFSCLIGKVLADLACSGETSVPSEPWRWDWPK